MCGAVEERCVLSDIIVMSSKLILIIVIIVLGKQYLHKISQIQDKAEDEVLPVIKVFFSNYPTGYKYIVTQCYT